MSAPASPAALAPAAHIVPAATVIPISAIQISNGMFSTLSNDSKFSNLCLSKDNWPKWSEKVLEVMQMTELDEYLTGLVPTPDGTNDPVSLRNWNGNNRKLVGFLKAHVESGEKAFLSSDNAQIAWSSLLKRHEKQGPITQVRLIQEALSISYPKDVAGWSAVSERIRDLCTRIFAQAVPNYDTMLMVLMLNALEREADHIRSEMTSYYVSNQNADSAALSSRIEQEVVYKLRRENSSDSALAMRAGKNFKRSQKVCTNPTCPHKIGHLLPDCHGPGGPMEGRRDEVNAKIARAKEEREKKTKAGAATTATNSTPGVRHDKSGRAYILDSESGQAVFLASVQPMPTPDLALAALSTNDIPREWYNDMSATDQHEYHALFLEEHSASVDWREERRMITPDAFLASSPNSDSRSKLSCNIGPFILDSGATIHISPDASDFFDLKPIPPRTIKGVGGSFISATGIGRIRLHIANGHTIILNPALFVPEAAVRLISVLVLGKGSQKLVSHFDGDGCWLTNRSGTTVASGKLSAIGRQLYTLDMGEPLAEHTFFTTRVPDLETWHRRLGHINYRSIVDMSDNQMTKGMHVDLSSAPPKCQSCILGKQTKNSVPKIREGPRAEMVLDCVYIDLTGPQSVQSASGNSYVMNIIDDATSYSWAIPLPRKSSAITVLKTWVPTVERQTGRKVGAFNIDNGELKSTEFIDFCASRGITLRWTSPHTSAQNGRVERVHRTLFDSARTMRSFSGLPANRWDEFIVTANYLRMRAATKTLNNITPYEAYFKHKPDISHLREIGC
jgi:GAG-pre-integrase domain/Integrase core domain